MTDSIYKEYRNKYYNPNDNDKKPGDNDNWKSIQEGFHRIGSTQLETSAGLTLGKGTDDEVSVTAAELEQMKNGGAGSYLLYTIDNVNGVSTKIDYTPFNIESLKERYVSNRVYSIMHSDDGEGTKQTIYTLEGQIMFFDEPLINNAYIYMPGVTYSQHPEITTNVNFVANMGAWYITDEGYIAEQS